ncbi:MAG: M20/M25/M40 family metallo-hydrolase, partial [Natronospirillum sp.]
MSEPRRHPGDQVLARCDRLAEFSDSPDYLCRAYLTPEHRAANDQVAQCMHALDMTTWEDAAGNLWGRYPGLAEGPALVVGSHLDTVRNAGRFDGMLGVVVPLSALQQLHDAGQRPAQSVEVVAFADEEGTRFGTTLLGSRAVTGQWDRAWHRIKDAEGVTLEQA